MLGITDLPCAASEKDTLGIEKYVEGLSKFIRACPTPMSIALQGDWGTGKTSVINKLQKALNNANPPVKCVYFNTWQYSQFNMSEDLYASFMHNLAAKLEDFKGADPRLKEVRDKFLRTGKLLTFGLVKKVVDVDADSLDAALKNELEKMRAVENLKATFEELVSSLTGDTGRLVIFIDDLDHLNPESAVELLEVIKLFMDVPKCIFVLAIDYGVVVSGVRKKFGDDISEEKCRSFFDKIIQLPFRMPVETYNLSGMLQETLHEYLDPAHIDVLSQMVRDTLGPNPRTFKRLANSFFLIYSVQSCLPERMGEVTRQDSALILCSLCLQMSIPHIYSKMLSFSGSESGAADLEQLIEAGMGLPSEGEEALPDILPDTLTPNERELLPTALTVLTKVLDAVLGGKKEVQLQQFLRVMALSSITGVESREAVRRAPALKVSILILNGERHSVSTPTDAFLFTFQTVLLRQQSEQPEKFEEFVRSHPRLLAWGRPEKSGLFRSQKEVIPGAPSLWIGTSSSTPLKMEQTAELCRFFGYPAGYTAWYDDTGTEVFSFQG